MESEIREIFEAITEHHQVPRRLGSRCEASSYYRVEDLSSSNIDTCATFIAERITNVCSPQLPTALINLPGGYTGLSEALSTQLASFDETLAIHDYREITQDENIREFVRDAQVVLVNDVITTARSCLEAHTAVTMLGSQVLCWACLIDRTFGPGPVPVVAAFTGAPVTLLEEIP